MHILIHLPLYFPRAPPFTVSVDRGRANQPLCTCPSPVQHAYTIQVITMALERQSGCPREKYILPYLLVLARAQ